MNLGELNIKIGVDLSGIESMKSAFNDAASAAERAASRMESAFDGVGSAARSTDEVGSSLDGAILKADLFANAIESAFSKVIDLAQSAAGAVAGFVADAVSGFAEFEQGVDSLNSTFGSYSNDFLSWMQNNSATYSMSVNEMMSHANKIGVILQKDSAESRQAVASGEQQTTEVQQQELSNRLQNLRASLSNQLAETREAQAAEYNSWKEYYSQIESQLKDQLQDEYDELKDYLDERVSEQQKANEKELRNRTAALDKEYQNYKDYLSNQLDVLKDALDSRLSNQRKANETELRERQRTLEDAYDAAKSAYDAEVAAFNAATNERIKQINKEYTERYKLIDEEKYARLKAIQDEIDAIDDQREATKRSKQDSKDEAKLATLREQYASARKKSTKEKLQKEIDALELSMQETQNDRLLTDRKEALKDEMSAVKEHYENQKKELKEEQSEELAQYKDSRAQELAALKQANSEKLKEIKRANQDEIQELKDAQKLRIEQITESNQNELNQAKSRNERLLSERKQANQEELQELRDSQKQQIDSMREENDRILKEKKRSNSQILDEQKSFDDQQLSNLKSSQAAQLREIQEHNRQVLQEQSNLISQQKKQLAQAAKSGSGYVETTDEDVKKSIESLKTLFKAAADVGAARNMTTDEVMSIFEGSLYGRFATFDNLGLGYANKTGVQQMVKDMGDKMGADLNPEDFNDVALALRALVEDQNMAGRAAKEAEETLSGSYNRLMATWDNFKTALATESPEDEEYFLQKLIGTGDDEKVISNFIDNLKPAIQRVVSSLTTILEEYGPQISEAIKPIVELVIDAIVLFFKEYAPKLASAGKEILSNLIPDDYKDAFDKIKLAVEGLAVVFGAFSAAQGVLSFINLFDRISTVVLPAVSGIMTGTVIPAIQSFMASASLVGAGLQAGLIGPLDLLSVALEAIGGPITVVIALIAGMIANSESLRNLLGSVAGTIKDVLVGALDMLSPILETLKGLWHRLNEALGFLGDKIAQVLQPAFDRLKETLGPPLQDVANLLKDALSKLGEAVLAIADAVGSVLKPVLDVIAAVLAPILEAIATFVGGVLGTLVEVLGGGLAGALDFLSTTLKVLADIIKTVADGIGGFLDLAGQQIENFSKGVDEGLKGVTEWFGGLFDKIMEALGSPIEWLEGVGSDIVNGLQNGFEKAWEGITGVFETSFSAIEGIARDALESNSPSKVFQRVGEDTAEGFDIGVGDGFVPVNDFFGGVPDALLGALGDFGSHLVGAGSGFVNGLLDGVTNFAPHVIDFFRGLPSDFLDSLGLVGTFLNGAGHDLLNGLFDGASNMGREVTSWFSELPNDILSSIGDLHNLLWDAGTNIVQGLSDGIESNFWAVGDTLLGGLNNAVDSAMRFLGIASPSKLFEWIGEMSMEGLGSGLEGQMSLVEDAMGEIEDIMNLDSAFSTSSLGSVSKGRQRYVVVNVGEMNVRSEQDIYSVAQQLDNIWAREMAGAL